MPRRPGRRLLDLQRHLGAWVVWLFTSAEGTRSLTAVASVGTLIGVVVAVFQLCDLPDQREARAITILLAVDQQLSAEHVRAVRYAVQKDKPLDGFDQEAIGDYLDVLEGLAINHERGLVSFDALDDWLGDTILRTYRHADVRRYIREQHRDDPDYYAGFLALGERLQRVKRSEAPVLRRGESH